MAEGIVTLLFTDLVGSTELLTTIGDEAAEAVRRQHFRLLRDAVAATGGQEVKNLGDGLMVVFTSAGEALRCAVEVQQAVERHGRRPGQVRLGVRVGLHVGEPIHDEDDYFGLPVVVAQRLCGAAEGGQILASDLVRSLASADAGVEFNSLGPIELKGLAEPVIACQVVWEASTTAPLALPLAMADQGPFVGRADELAELADLWEAVRSGNRQLAFVVGEPGIGKTRMATQLALVAHTEGALVLYGRSDEDGLVPYQPFLDALRPYVLSCPAEILEKDLAAEAAELARLLPEITERVAILREPTEDDPATERYRLFESVASLFAHAAATTPVLLILDDLHWADKPTVLLLRHLMRAPRDAALLVVGIYRDSELGPDRPLGAALADLRRDQRYTRIRLRGLPQRDVAELVGLWASEDLAAAFSRSVYEETEGNPFFVAEVVRHLLEVGALYQHDLAIPEGVREVVVRRLQRLSTPTNRLLGMAAVVGQEFDVTTLAKVAEIDEVDLLEALEEGIEAQVLLEVPGAVDQYAFSHALVRKTLYDEMSTTRRVRLHRRIGEVLEEAEIGEPRLAQLAYHFGEAAAGGDAEKAVTYATRAGERALSLLAYEEAASYFRAALNTMDPSGDENARSETMLALGDAEWRAGDIKSARECFLTVAESARRTRRADHLARAALGYGAGPGGYGWIVRADDALIELLEDALLALGPSDSPLRVRVLGRLAAELYYKPAAERRDQLTAEAGRAAGRIGDPSVLLTALVSRQAATWGPDRHVKERLAACGEIIELGERLGEVPMALDGRSLRLDALMEMGDIAAADVEHATRSRVAEQLRMPRYLSDVVTYPAARAMLAGDFDGTQRLGERALEIGELVDNETNITVFGAQMICLRWLQGDVSELLPLLVDFADRYPWIPGFRGALALMYADSGELDKAREQFERLAVADFGEIPRDGIWSVAMWSCGLTCAALDDRERAVVLSELMRPFADSSAGIGASLYLGSLSTPLGSLGAVLERWDEAEADFERAVASTSRAGARPFVVHAMCNYAEMLRRRDREGDRQRAVALATEALEEADALGLAGFARRLRDVVA